VESHSRVLITGADGFTGVHLAKFLRGNGYSVFPLSADLLDYAAFEKEMLEIAPNFVIHLAGISFAEHSNREEIYRVNTLGSINLLETCLKVRNIRRVILASSAAVYGNQSSYVLEESMCPHPISHYGCSKLNMELLSKSYSKYFPITIVRPFNYTGVGHHEIFVIPKIVKAFKERITEISLGNINVYREFNDVRDVCAIYEKLLITRSRFDIVNICSGKPICLRDVISTLELACEYKPKIKVDKKFVRKNDIDNLSGSPARLHNLIDYEFKFSITNTLNWMLQEK
jgi:nucleoside-diphosphate-sugar epimerase